MRQRSAFSLLELSIVLAIIGLLAGAVVGGQAVLANAELKAVATNSQAYLAAVGQFRTQYGALPGDMRNATNYWGASPSCPNSLGAGTATCNGNGDRIIGQWDEMYAAWKHLSNAGFVTGGFTGTYTLVSARGVGVAGTNIPGDRLPQSAWSLTALTPNLSTTPEIGYSDLPARTSNWLYFGKTSSNQWASAPVMLVRDAYELDKKIDDGKPARGRIFGGPSSACATTLLSTTAEYALATSNQCALAFQIQ